MRKIITIILLTCSIAASAQVRHAKGIYSAEIAGGLSQYGYYLGAGASYYFTRNLYVSAMFNYEKKELEDSGGVIRKQKSYYLDMPGAFTFYNINDVAYFNIVGGPTAGVYTEENIGETSVPSAFKFGGLLGGEIEVFINSNIALLVNGNVKYLFGQEYGHTRSYIGMGIKYSF